MDVGGARGAFHSKKDEHLRIKSSQVSLTFFPHLQVIDPQKSPSSPPTFTHPNRKSQQENKTNVYPPAFNQFKKEGNGHRGDEGDFSRQKRRAPQHKKFTSQFNFFSSSPSNRPSKVPQVPPVVNSHQHIHP